mmetsp:Transcript_18598/g.34452  ORF Transcript_18598/g.34452 Transcript_18598/m.34452 type:complete len:899 (+) Transcript_18598:133-2829(+)
MSEDTDNDDDDSTVFSKSKLHLNPHAVITLAKSIPNCSRVKPPKDYHRNINASSSTNTGGGGSGANNNASSATGNKIPAARRSKSDSAPSSSYFSTESTSYFSTFSRRLHLTFSNDEKQDEEYKNNQKAENEILSFMVSDTHSIEQLAAEAADDEAGGKHASTSDLQGAGIARIDVYCQSGTVITCRVIPTADTMDAVDGSSSNNNNPSLQDHKNNAVDTKEDDANDGRKPRERSSSFLQMLPTPRKDNVSQTTKEGNNNDNIINTQEGTQVRHIIRRKCTMDALRRIFEQPPKLPEINECIITDYQLPSPNSNTNYDNDSNNNNNNTDDSSQGSTVSKILRKRQQKRQTKKHQKFSKLSKEQNTFLKAQQKKYEKRIRRDEKVRRHVGNAILAAGMGGMGSEMGVDLTSMHSLSLDDTTVTSGGGGTLARSDGNGMHNNPNNNNSRNDGGGGGVGSGIGAADSDIPAGDAYHAQKAIQDKIEIADMGLAILMGEAQQLERIMATMRETRDKDLETDCTDEGSKGGDTDGDTSLGSVGSKRRNRRARGGNVDDDDDDDDDSRSYSTMHSTDREVGDDSTIGSRTSAGSNSSLEDSSWEERKLARLMQGCEIEYSFPHDYHDELEGALMNDDMEGNSSSEESDEEDSNNEEEDASRASSKVVRRRRGRSPPKDGVSSPPTNASSLHKNKQKLEVSPIVAVPTNGEGCVVLRENGAFDVVGKIPAILRKKLFRSKGPMPDQIALGTLGRYYVHFVDGSFFFYGPPAMSKTLIHGNKQKQRRGKDRNRGKRGEVSVVSVAFGKKLDDFFIVRSDGSWESNGSSPAGLDGLMEDRKGRADLLWVALGANGEWCVRSKHGRVWWEGVSVEADEALADILAEDGENELKFIDFGKDDTYFLLHK